MSNPSLDSTGASDEFWFNIKTGQVEQGKVSAAPYRIGPFSSRTAAERALETISSRSKQWATEDEQDS